MAYKVGLTNIPGDGFRPWQARLSGLGRMGDYRRATFYTPTPTRAYNGEPVTGGLGLDLSSLTSNPMLLIGLGAAAWYFFFRKK